MPQSTLTPCQKIQWTIGDYDLATTLTCGQAFRWQPAEGGWEGVIGQRWVRLQQAATTIEAQVCAPPADWSWLHDYLQTKIDLSAITETFPEDEPLRQSVKASWGLRLLRQEPWECLASFILSANKQIVQIQQIISSICSCWGEPLRVPSGHAPAWAFPPADVLATASEAELRACKMGFRAPNLLSTARSVADGKVDLTALHDMRIDQARAILMELPGVGPKIADCVLLFAYSFPTAFPVDVWVMKALRELYFRRRKRSPLQLRKFVESHFGPHAGYAQQYLFHYMRQHQIPSALPA